MMTTQTPPAIRTLGELRESGWKSRSVKAELRENLVRRLRAKEQLFPGILGYEQTVIPQVQNAILACHDILLLGLRGQAKTRLARSLVGLLDPWMPAISGSPLRDDPYRPLSKAARHAVDVHGDHAEIEWIPAAARYHEKLATPDVSIADLIGDVDPIKAVARKLDLSDEEVIHYGLIPRSNRGIFAINELPDLQARIQVGLLNILEEKDIQIRGFPIRLPLDLMMLFTANPEDYTNRGNIITPLKDRIAAQILTHYPDKLSTALEITAQEAWTRRENGVEVHVPAALAEIVERVAVEARKSEYVDQKSGVSARLSIALYETVVSAAEKRAFLTGESRATARVCDLFEAVPAITGKVELVYTGEQQGAQKVAWFLVGRAVREAFNSRAIPKYKPGRDRKYDFKQFAKVANWFDAGNALELGGDMPDSEYKNILNSVPGLADAVAQLSGGFPPDDKAFAMELIIEGLNQNYVLTKQVLGPKSLYRDSANEMMGEADEG